MPSLNNPTVHFISHNMFLVILTILSSITTRIVTVSFLFNQELIDRYRLPRHDIIQLETELQDELKPQTRRNFSMSSMQQLLLALRYYATGSFQRIVGDTVQCDQSTCSRAINRVSVALQRRLGTYVYFPQSPQTLHDTIDQFYSIAQFPRVLGCIDGTQIRILAPSHNEMEFVNRKGFHSMNIQLICDAKLKFINCVIKWPGSTHDARILSNSSIYRAFEEGRMNGFILGDSAYPLKSWLMTPFIAPSTAAEDRYNGAFLPTRCTVERAIGVLKRRWACLQTGLRLSPEKSVSVIASCIILHNRCMNQGLPLPEEEDAQPDEEDDDEDEAQPQGNDAGGKQQRNILVNRCFSQ